MKTHFKARRAHNFNAVDNYQGNTPTCGERGTVHAHNGKLEMGVVRHYPKDVENAMIYPYDDEDEEDYE